MGDIIFWKLVEFTMGRGVASSGSVLRLNFQTKHTNYQNIFTFAERINILWQHSAKLTLSDLPFLIYYFQILEVRLLTSQVIVFCKNKEIHAIPHVQNVNKNFKVFYLPVTYIRLFSCVNAGVHVELVLATEETTTLITFELFDI